MHLAQAHTDLCRQLGQTIVKSDAAFLASAEAHANKLAQPLAAVQIRSQRRGARDGAALSWSEERSAGELVARAEEQLAQFERGVAGLWAEWAAAESEVRALLRGMVIPLASPLSGEGYAGDGETGDGAVDDGEGEQLLRRLREAIEREIECAEEDVFELGEEAVTLMKGIEKDFRKDTLADLHIFFQSIDEP
ncbi:hypothetical protein C7999DRAFT_27798 [Corynascus novoguineensis]|uniref:Uncharacterized protein n=1 Tax=Corynascus novoguineensis TaxID=1126955 RepID=A0AAN7D0Z8_9PEZI|nr:hypothetical protein C7999DRAFT_27798 [Corynascus novoguineensis]